MLDDQDAPLYTIGVVAELLGVDVQTLRRHDQAGLLKPGRSAAGQRRYSRRDIAQLARTLELASEGIPTAGIERILDLEERLRRAESAAGQGEPHRAAPEGRRPRRDR